MTLYDPWQRYPIRRRVRIPVHSGPPRPSAPAPEPAQDELEQTPEATWRQRYARLQADLENTKKRLEKRYAIEAEQSRLNVLRDMLPLADNLERALHYQDDQGAAGDGSNPQAVSASETQGLRAGVELTLTAFLDTLARYGVQRIAAERELFDPTLHEAVGQVQDGHTPSGHVAQVVQTGYTVDGALLRPARVLVAA